MSKNTVSNLMFTLCNDMSTLQVLDDGNCLYSAIMSNMGLQEHPLWTTNHFRMQIVDFILRFPRAVLNLVEPHIREEYSHEGGINFLTWVTM